MKQETEAEMNIVLDTNILISAAWSRGRNASAILNAAFARKFTVCYDSRIFAEYTKVFHYPKMHFSEEEIESVLCPLFKNGISVIPNPIRDIPFDRDETDRKFYEVAKFCHAVLITGNLRHYPEDPDIMNATDFCKKYM